MRGWAEPLAIGVAVTLLQAAWALAYGHSLLEMQYSDEGFKLDAAYRVLQGQVPYRDFYVLEGPLLYYVTAGAFALFGAKLLVGHWLMAAIATLTAAIVYALGRQVLNPRAAGYMTALWVVVGLPSWPMLHDRWLATLLCLGATLAALAWLRCRQRAALAVAGLLYALGALTHQTVGGGLGLSLGAVLLQERDRATWLRSLAALAGGALAPAALVALYFAATGALAPLLYDTFVSPFTQFMPHQTKIYLPSPYDSTGAFQLAGVAELLVTALTMALAPVALALTFGSLALHRAPLALRPVLLLYSLVGLGMLGVAATHATRYVVVTALPLSLVLLVYWLERLRRLGSPRRRRLTTIYLALVLALLPLGLHVTTFAVFVHPFDPARYAVETPRGRVFAETQPQARSLRLMLDFIQARVPPGGSLWVGPTLPMLYFISGRHNPTPYDMIAISVYTWHDFEQTAAILERSRPAAVIWAPATNSYEDLFNVDREQRATSFRLLERVFRRCYRLAAGEPGVIELLEYDPVRCG